MRLALFLEMSTTIGSIIGALIAVYTNQTVLLLLFSLLLVYAGYTMFRHSEKRVSPEEMAAEGQMVDLSCQYVDPKDSCEVRYGVKGLRKGLGYSSVAGLLSGLLGVGGGLVKVPVMNVCMCVPLKAATATSNFMIGVTALTGAIIFYGHGLLDAYLCAAVALGVFAGAYLGTRSDGPALLGAASRLVRHTVVHRGRDHGAEGLRHLRGCLMTSQVKLCRVVQPILRWGMVLEPQPDDHRAGVGCDRGHGRHRRAPVGPHSRRANRDGPAGLPDPGARAADRHAAWPGSSAL